MKKLTNIGDTIVEVLIAIAVLGVVLAGAYTIANRSLSNIRQAQEHTEALKLAEEQAERLRQLASTGGATTNAKNIFNGANPPFCLEVSASGLELDDSASDPKCKQGSIPYQISVSVNHSGSSYTYTIQITWDGIHGGTDNVTMYYRLDS